MGTLETCELKWLWKLSTMTLGFLWWLCADQESACQYRKHWFNPWVRKIPWRRNWQPTPVFLPGESHGQSGRLQSMGLQRVRYNWATNTHVTIFKSTIEKVMLTICILLCKTFIELFHFCKTDTLYSLNNSPFPLHLSPWQPPFYFLRVGPL